MNIRELQLWASDRVSEHLASTEDGPAISFPEVTIVLQVPPDADTVFAPAEPHLFHIGTPAEAAEELMRLPPEQE